jgi:hypothetical protein
MGFNGPLDHQHQLVGNKGRNALSGRKTGESIGTSSGRSLGQAHAGEHAALRQDAGAVLQDVAGDRYATDEATPSVRQLARAYLAHAAPPPETQA